jgi:phosphatidylglycerophosphate synthase
MAAPNAQATSLEATYKLREAEGVIDLYFYRKVGFFLARLFHARGVTPIGVTIMGGALGIVAGHLYFYRDLATNIAGMLLHISANAFDNADGQLARLTGRGSRDGRIIDSLVDHLIFVSIYVHLALRCLVGGASPFVLLLALAAGLSHAAQGMAADYFRNGYLYFANGAVRAQFDTSSELLSDFRKLDWHLQPWKKFLLALYLNFTRQQEILAPKLRRLRDAVDRFFPTQIPLWLKVAYRAATRPMFKWWGLLMTNTRMVVLFAALFLDRPAWYFWIELTVLNALLVLLLFHQGRSLDDLLLKTAKATAEPAHAEA